MVTFTAVAVFLDGGSLVVAGFLAFALALGVFAIVPLFKAGKISCWFFYLTE
jgi:hypothetical protein